MPLQIGREIGRGGEGTVYEVVGRDDIVIKMYHNPPPDDIEAKLAAMIRHNRRVGLSTVGDSHVAIAWPQQVHRLPDGRIGYTMHYALGAERLFMIRIPGVVRTKGWNVKYRDLLHVAYNVALTVSTIHDGDYVIGDLKDANILVTSRGQVVFVDTDSFRIRTEGRLYPCKLKTDEYLAPELVGRDLSFVERNRTHDNFALGVLIFQLLMNGWHPFAGVWPGESDDPPPVEQWIRRGLFPYGGCSYVDGRQLRPPPAAAPRFDTLDRRLRDYFQRCFVLGHKHPHQRPSAREWATLLRSLIVPAPSPPAAPRVTRREGSGRASWTNVNGAAGYDLRWKQAGAWTQIPNAVSPRTIAPLVNGAGVDVQVRAKNSTGASAWSPIGSAGPTTPSPPAAPTVTRDERSDRAAWEKVIGATDYDLRWRQRGAWKEVRNVVSPRTIGPLVRRRPVDIQVRAKNGTGASAWSPIGSAPPVGCFVGRSSWVKKIVFGVALLAVIMIGVWSIGVTGREGRGSTASREDTGATALPEDRDGAATREDDRGTASPADSGGAASREDDDSTAPRADDGGAAPSDEPAVVPTYPRIRSLVRLDPSEHWTNADSVTWRITFTEAVTNVDERDFVVIGIRPWRLTVTNVGESGDVYDITLDSRGLADHNGTVTLASRPACTSRTWPATASWT